MITMTVTTRPPMNLDGNQNSILYKRVNVQFPAVTELQSFIWVNVNAAHRFGRANWLTC
jgi:hypothetical protein